MNPNRNSNKITNRKVKIILPELSYKLMGVLFSVHNELGPGLLERHYQRAIEKDLLRQGIPFEKELQVNLTYRDEPIGKYYLDFVIKNKIVLETKAQKCYNPKFFKQVFGYLRQTKLPLAILVNFRRPKLEFKRIINPYYSESIRL